MLPRLTGFPKEDLSFKALAANTPKTIYLESKMLPKWYTPPHLRTKKRLPSAKVIEAVSKVFDVSVCDIRSDLRHKKFSMPRHV
ncbi:hypothetical protein DMO24_24065, partial [Modestobacter versicolor]